MPKLPADSSYLHLIRTVKAALKAGIVDVQRFVEYQRVKTYWTIGRGIGQAAEFSDGKLVLDDALYTRISRDIFDELNLDLSVDTLKRTVQFAHEYPAFPKDTPLTFTHYLALMRVEDPAERLKLEHKAVKENLSSPQLKEAVLLLNESPRSITAGSVRPLTVERGEPYIYYARSYEDLAGHPGPCVDCGFKIHLPLEGSRLIRSSGLKDGTSYVRSVKIKDRYELRLAVRKRASVYTYAARVMNVVDADTLDALIDVGFGIRVFERFRLKSINAPELTSFAGRKARDFLVEQLSTCPVIIVRTQKAEMYGRWLGDVFTLKGVADPYKIAEKGEYLNQRLLDEGLAQRY